jgi:hypothetical protein
MWEVEPDGGVLALDAGVWKFSVDRAGKSCIPTDSSEKTYFVGIDVEYTIASIVVESIELSSKSCFENHGDSIYVQSALKREIWIYLKLSNHTPEIALRSEKKTCFSWLKLDLFFVICGYEENYGTNSITFHLS